ncbi:MAG TPA: transcriptional regulator NrdR [Bacteriovoracaceae bacterium]|nr:transcriptional regulator NrdR [Bacteriovoracaceae bacterium]
MKCPYCSAPDTKVLDSRNLEEASVIRRRRKCEGCQKRFTTFETVELSMPMVIKRDNRREPYLQQKILHGIEKACEKRPISAVQIERIINNIEKAILDISDKEVQSIDIGNLVMMYLRHLDPVAYIRFAAVYRKFQDVEEFVNELKHDEHNQFKIISPPGKDVTSEH